MGGCASKAYDDGADGGGRRKEGPEKSSSTFLENIFSAAGRAVALADGDVMLEQGATTKKMYFIKSGKIKLFIKHEDGSQQEIAERGSGEVLGELSMLLGSPYNVTAKANGSTHVIEVEQGNLLTILKEDPMNAGFLFKFVAIYLSDRIAELSSKMRSNVTKSQSANQSNTKQTISAGDVSRARSLFATPSDKKLIGVYQCSVRKEVNAVKEANAHFGEMYIFEHALCFDLKMFAFHKQMTHPIDDVVKFLKSETEANCIDLQLKGQSIELLIPEGFDEACMLMEAARVQAKAAMLSREHSGPGKGSASGEAVEAGTLDDFHHVLEPIVKSAEKKADVAIVDLQLQEEDWGDFLGVAKQRKYKKGEYVIREG